MLTMTRSAVLDKFHSPNGDGIFQQKKWVDIIDKLRPDSTITVNFMEDNMYEYLSQLDPTEFKSIVREAIIKVLETRLAGSMNVAETFEQLKIRLVSDSIEKMHGLNAREHENTVVTFDCDVIAVERQKTYIKSCQAYCPLCGSNYDSIANEDRKLDTLYCMNGRCKKAKLIIRKSSLNTDNIQVIYLQEPMNLARNNSPIILKGLLIGNLCGNVFIGQKKRITGIFKSQIDLLTNENEIVIEIVSEQDRDEKTTIDLTEEQIKSYKLEAKNEDEFIDKITNSFAPMIIGYKDIKLSILLMLVGGHSSIKREDINIMLVGDPSMAKSELLKFGNKITEKSMYTSGKGSSAAGLTVGLVKMERGNFVAQAGVLPLCSGGYAFIDEFDKMSTDDRSALHEAMEQQTVSIAKAGFKMTLPAKTPILAAANPKYGKYDPSQSLLDNIDIPPPLISRFDLIWLIRDKVDKESDLEKARFILDSFTGTLISTSTMNECQLSSYINYVRELPVELTDQVKQEIINIYTKMRELSSGGVVVGTRQLEALVRLTMAHAKLLQKEKTDLNDIKCVKEIVDNMFKQFNINMNYTQDNMAISGKQKREHIINDIWNKCKNTFGQVVYRDFIKALVDNNVFDEKGAKEYFGKMERECLIKDVGDNRYVKI